MHDSDLLVIFIRVMYNMNVPFHVFYSTTVTKCTLNTNYCGCVLPHYVTGLCSYAREDVLYSP